MSRDSLSDLYVMHHAWLQWLNFVSWLSGVWFNLGINCLKNMKCPNIAADNIQIQPR